MTSWLFIAFSSILFGLLFITFSMKINVWKEAFHVCFISLQSHLGHGDFSAFVVDGRQSMHGLFFVALLFGNVVCIAYNGFLTSDLIVPKISKPFEDFPTLLETNFILNVEGNTILSSYFEDSGDKSIARQVLEKNTNQRSFQGLPEDLMERTINGDEQTYFDQADDIPTYKNYVCKVRKRQV